MCSTYIIQIVFYLKPDFFFYRKRQKSPFYCLFSETLLISRDFNKQSFDCEPFVHTNLIILHAKSRNNERII